MAFHALFNVETEEEERERLASAPVGSTSHFLSTLPVTIPEWPEGLVIELPSMAFDDRPAHRIVVVPVKFRPEPRESSPQADLRRRFPGAWTCIVVGSDHPSYPVGGHQLSVGSEQLARGRRIDVLER